MFDQETLSQLNKLKADIHSSREFAEGTVASTNGRFGFVRLEDGRDAYLSPEKMQHVLPGDKVKVELKQNSEGKLEAHLEKLISSELKRFIAHYRVKGNAHFVEPLAENVNRWIFVAPKYRTVAKVAAQEGQVLVAKVIQHPWKDGKAQAKILEIIGQENDAFFAYKAVCAKYALNLPLAKDLEKDISNIHKVFDSKSFGDRSDLSDKPFVTIDAASTRDMDDALTIEKNDNGFVLEVAIADPSSFISKDSPLAKHAERKSQTLYLNGGVLPMLEEALANNTFSLTENEIKPALVCKISLNKEAKPENYEFSFATIKPRHKLIYENVTEWLTQDYSEAFGISEEIFENLRVLEEFSTLRAQYRTNHNLVYNEQTDYQFILDEQGQIKEIIPKTKTRAHQIVEECMLLTNLCAGEFLANHQCGLHVVHSGFRGDRIGEVRALLKEENLPEENIDTLEGYSSLMRKLSRDNEQSIIVPALRKMSEASRLSAEPSAHMGLGLEHYATITSPIRRFADLYNHWMLRAILEKKTTTPFDETRLFELNEQIQIGRKADRELRQTLIINFAKKLKDKVGEATIRIVTPQGFGARFDDIGIDGFVQLDKSLNKNFDAKRLLMKVDDQSWHIGKKVKVKLVNIDNKKQRIAFALAD